MYAVAAAANAAGNFCQQAVQALEQVKAAANFQLQAVLAPGEKAGRDAVGPATQLLQAALFGTLVPLQQLRCVMLGQGMHCCGTHARADTQGGGAVIGADHPLPGHYHHRLVFLCGSGIAGAAG